MKTKRTFSVILAFLAFAFTALAQNMTQKQANENLTGTWLADGKTLVISANGNTHSANIFGQDFDNWSIYTNTFNFESGSLQATNSSPFRNITIKYRFLTANSCEFFIDGNWVKASKSGSGQRTTTNTTRQPETNNNNVRKPVNMNKVERPAKGTIQQPATINTRQPETNNNNVRRPVNTNKVEQQNAGTVQQPANNTTRQPETNNNNVRRPINMNKVERPTRGTIQQPANNRGNLRRPLNNNNTRRPANDNSNNTNSRNDSATPANNATGTVETSQRIVIN